MHRRSRVLAVFLVWLVALGAPAAAINDGRDAEPGEIQSMALVIYEGGTQCGGTLVASNKVLTAAHCILGGQTPYVALGSPTLPEVYSGPYEELYEGVDIQVHPHYTGETSYDVAVIKFAGTSTRTPARIAKPSESALWTAGKEATIAGWGITSNSSGASDVLQVASVPFVDCITDATLGCAGGRAAKACLGDSGGPVLADSAGQQVLVGVITGGSMDCEDTEPGMFAHVGREPLQTWLRTQLDTVRPKVSAASPTGTGIRRDTSLKATFSEPMKRATLTADTFKVFRKASDGTFRRINNVTVKSSLDGRTATLNPYGSSTTKLAAFTKFKVVVTTAVRDVALNRLDQNRTAAGYQNKVWYFKTGAD